MKRAALLVVLACGCDRLLGLTSVSALPDAPVPDAPIVGQWVQVAGGKYATCAIDSADHLYCFGSNASAQLGVGATVDYALSPMLVTGNWTAVASQGLYGCAIADDGSLWCWGHEESGELGNGVAAGNYFVPVPVVASTGTRWTAVATGTSHTCGIQSDQSLWCWGSNMAGESDGLGSVSPIVMPTKIIGAATAWTGVAVGSTHTCAIDVTGRLWCWGGNDRGQLGNGLTGPAAPTPAIVAGPAGWTAVSATGAHTCGVRGGELDCWGDNQFGQLGDGTTTNREIPAPVAANGTWIAVATADRHTCALQDGHTWWCWGGDDFGELAMADASLLPRAIPSSWRAIASGNKHSCAIDAARALYCVGLDADGQLGDGRGGPLLSPAAIGGATYGRVFAGSDTSCALEGNQLVCWGDNTQGQLGNQTISPAQQPTTVDTTPVIAAATRQTHTCEIDTLARMRCAGDNTHGNFGVAPGTIMSSTSMVSATTGSGLQWTQVAVGRSLTCAISTELPAKLYCFGVNDRGQAAVPGGADVTSPTAVNLTGTPTVVGVGDSFACGIYSGSAYCWGNSTAGETGAPAGSSSATPTKITGGHTFMQLAVGGLHVCGLDALGGIYCWGDNRWGQLGDNTQNDTTTPVAVASVKTWTKVAAGGAHTCAIDNQQDLYCWGRNVAGQLGDGSRVDRRLPTAVGGMEKWVDVAAGDTHTCGLTMAGLLRCWGSRSTGQIGDGMAWRSTLALVPSQ